MLTLKESGLPPSRHFPLPPSSPPFYSLSSPTKFGLRSFLGACAGSRMSLGVPDGSSTQALEDVIAGVYQARWARVSALVMLLWDHGNLVRSIPALCLAYPLLCSHLSGS